MYSASTDPITTSGVENTVVFLPPSDQGIRVELAGSSSNSSDLFEMFCTYCSFYYFPLIAITISLRGMRVNT